MKLAKLKEQDKNKNYLILLLCFVCIILSALVVALMIDRNKKRERFECDCITTCEKINNTNIDNNTINDLITYIPVTNNKREYGNFIAYANSKISVDDLNYDNALSIIFPYLDKSYIPANISDSECSYYILEDTIRNELFKRYGNHIIYESRNEINPDDNNRCILTDDYYSCYTNDSIPNSFDGNIGAHHHRVTSSLEDGDYLYIYEDYFYLRYYVVESEDLISFEIYNNYLSNNSIDGNEYLVKDYIKDNKDYNYEQDLFNLIGDKVSKYKHTFMKSDDGYIWISTETY